jgi:hypothetical protein
MTDASPRPWRVVVRPGVSDTYVNIVDAHDSLIASWAWSQEAEDRAALIVRAVNWLDRSDATLVSNERWALMQAVIDAARALEEIARDFLSVNGEGYWDELRDAQKRTRSKLDALDGKGE